ncbi:MAG: hypothetical protein VB144_08120 [Clostridia bacterium]|nr:hypothetical protein [Clostridia bacterium]
MEVGFSGSLTKIAAQLLSYVDEKARPRMKLLLEQIKAYANE